MIRRTIALGLAWVMAVSSMLWAAPPIAQYPGLTSNPTPYVPVEPPILKLARALEEMMAEPGLAEPSAVPAYALTPSPPPPPPPAPPAPPVESLPRLVSSFAFGADGFTRETPNAPGTSYTKVVQDGANFLYSTALGYGYTDVDGLDTSPNNRGVVSELHEIYDQFIGAKPAGEDIVFRVDVPNGTYRFVAAGGDARYGNHKTTVRVRDGAGGAVVTLVENFRNPNCEFWRVGFDGRRPPDAPVLFGPLGTSGELQVTQGFIEVHQIAGTGQDIAAGGDLSLLELWIVAESTPVPPPDDLVRAFAFGADGFTIASPNAPGVLYTKIVQDGSNFLYDGARGFGYSDVSGLDTSPNNRGVLSGPDEIYDQFIGAKPGGATIVFRVDLPNGHYRLVAAGGDAKYTNHDTTILARDGTDGATTPLVTNLKNPENQFFRIGFDGKHPPMSPAVNFLPLSSSPTIAVTRGFLEIHQKAGSDAAAGGDLSILEIWRVVPEPPPEDFVVAFAFGADDFTRETPNAPVVYTKVVQDGYNFSYDAARGYGYTNLSGLDTSPNNRAIFSGDDEIYDQFIGAKPGGASIVFRIDVPPGEYRFVAAGGDARYGNHQTSVRVRDGSSGAFVSLVENFENPAMEFYRVGFDGRSAPASSAVNFVAETESPTLVVTAGYIEVHQQAGAGFAAGGDLSLLEIWRPATALPPTVVIELPADGGFFTSGDVPVRVRFANAPNVRVVVDGLDRTGELTLGAGTAEGTLTLLDGAHDLEAVAATVTASAMFSVDTEAPVLALDPPAPYVATSPLVVTGTLTDRDPSASVACSAAVLTLETTTPDGLRQWSFTCSFDLGEGSNALEVTASDTGGRQATASASVVLDTIAPEITILSPTPDTYTMASSINVSGGVVDASPVTVSVDSIEATVTGSTFEALNVPVAAASNVLRAVATDAAGNRNEATVTVLFDVEPPVVTLTAPADGAFLRAPVTVTGTVSDTAPVVLVNVNGQPVMVDAGGFETILTASDGGLPIVATAQDAAGNSGSAEVTVTVDSTPPALVVTSPLDGAVTGVQPLSVEGSVSDATPVQLELNGVPFPGFPVPADLVEGPNTLEVRATDAAGNSSSVSIGVVLDTVAPQLFVITPSEGEVFASLPLLAQGTVLDATVVTVVVNGVPATLTGTAWQAELTNLSEQTQAITIVATDAAGNATTVVRNATLDLSPPELTLLSPTTGLLTRELSVDVSGTVTDATAVSVTVNGAPVPVLGGSFLTTQALVDGDNPIRVVATDEAGRSSEVNVVVTQDAIPPVLELATPAVLSGITSGKATALASDNLLVAEVIFRVDGVERARFPGPPYEIDLTRPDGALVGDTIVVTAEATDTAGNVTTVNRGITIIEDGVIVGQVLDDGTSLPIEGATVVLGSRSVLTNERGQYSLPTGEAEVVIRVEKDGMTPVERRTPVLADVGTVPVDARLTKRTGATTTLSPQGLPGLLPLGWSPLSAFELTAPTTVAVPENTYLVQYRFSLHEWVMVSLVGPMDFDVTEAGTYAVVVPDSEVVAPAIGEMLEGVDVAILPASVTTSGTVDPPILPPQRDGVATGSLSLFSPVPLPSGTLIQAEITESFSLASGDVVSEETRYEDILLYREPSLDPEATLSAAFPISAFSVFEPSELVTGEVNLELLAGRESVRGERAGSRKLTVEQGDFRFAVPEGALAEDTAIDLRTFDPASFGALSEVYVDLSGQTLGLGGELSMAAGGLSADDTYVLARITRIDGVPKMEFVALAHLEGERLTAPGVRTQGSYVFYQVLSPTGFVAGVTSLPRVVVETAGLPFIALSDATGAYRALALTGPITVDAHVPRSSLRASGSVDVLAGETTLLDLTLTGQLTTATVTPPDGTLGVAVTTQITITSATALDAAKLGDIRIFDAGIEVPLRRTLSSSGKTLALIPTENLKFQTTYTLEAASIEDVFGGAVVVPLTQFTTRAKEALSVTPEAITLSLPDPNGIVQVSAAGLPPGTTVLLVNAGNGIVVSFTYIADGPLGEIPASISDRILITLTDPAGSIVSFQKSKFVAEDGTTAIGPGGGTVEGPGGVELRIPDGALRKGIELNIRSVEISELLPEDRPDLPGASLASGIRIVAPAMPEFQTEVDLAFPLPPDAPEGAFFYVYRKLDGPNEITHWETIDHAFVDNGKVVTASKPFSGYHNSFGSFQISGFLGAAQTTLFVLAWTFDALNLNRARTGVITGRVLRTVLKPGTSAPDFIPVENAIVTGKDVSGNSLFGEDNAPIAVSQSDGTYTLFDRQFLSGRILVSARLGAETAEATAFEFMPSEGSQLRFYESRATADIILRPLTPKPAPPKVEIVVMREVSPGTRERIDGFVVQGENLLIGARSDDTITSIRVDGLSRNFKKDAVSSNLPMNVVLESPFLPATVGVHTIEATAVSTAQETSVSSTTLRVIAPGGSNNAPLNDHAPEVVTDLTVPRAGATEVAVTIFPRVVFTEPVKNIPQNAILEETSTGLPVDVVLSGVGPTGPIPEVTSAAAEVTSLTFVPLRGLKYGAEYRIRLTDEIVDSDVAPDNTPSPKRLKPFESTFTTFGPTSLGRSEETFGTAGVVVLGDRAFVLENLFYNGVIRVFDVSDPANPTERLEGEAWMPGRPVDLAGELPYVVAATSSTNQPLPSNLYIFDVSSNTTDWVGAISVARSASEGFLQKVALRHGVAYALVGRKGLVLVDIADAIADFNKATRGFPYDSLEGREVIRKLGTNGVGFGAAGTPIKLEKGPGSPWLQYDLSMVELLGKTFAVLTGEAPLLLVDTTSRQVLSPIDVQVTRGPPDDQVLWSLVRGDVVASRESGGQTLAAIAGVGTVGPEPAFLFVTADITDPAKVDILSIIKLPIDSSPVDIQLTDDLAIIGTDDRTLLVRISDPANPEFAGLVENGGGFVALTESSGLVQTSRSRFGSEDEQRDLRTASLGHTTAITNVIEPVVVLAADRTPIERQTIEYRAFFPLDEVVSSELQVLHGESIHLIVDAPLDAQGRGRVTLPQETAYPGGIEVRVRLVVNAGKPNEPAAPARLLESATFETAPFEGLEMRRTGDGPLEMAAINAGLIERFSRDTETGPTPLLLLWSTVGAGGTLNPVSGITQDGLYATEYDPGGKLGQAQVELRMIDGTLMARSHPVNVAPGLAASATLRASAPPQNQSAPPRTLPADGTTEIEIRIENVTDGLGGGGYLLPDGTEVGWSILEGDGQLSHFETQLTSGGSFVTYKAGTEAGTVVIQATVDEESFEIELELARLSIKMTTDLAEYELGPLTVKPLEIEVTSAAGPAADTTPVRWGATLGGFFLENNGSDSLSGGMARAEHFLKDTHREFRFYTNVTAFVVVGTERAAFVYPMLSIPPEAGQPVATLSSPRILGDDVGGLDGPIPIPSETELSLTGGTPGEEITLALGSARSPNVQPFATFRMNSLDGTHAPDLYDILPGTAAPSVALDLDAPVGMGSYRFIGQGGISVQHSPVLALPTEFGFNGWVRFESLTSGQEILHKEGSFGLSVVDHLGAPHLEFFVFTGGERRSVVSTHSLEPSVWLHFSAHVRGDRLHLRVGDNDDVDIGEGGTVDVSVSPLLIGPSLEGLLDEVEIYDFTRTPLAVFLNGATTTSLTFDAQGEAKTTVRSTGTLFQPQPDAVVRPRGVVRVVTIPDPPISSVMPQSPIVRFLHELKQGFVDCFNGIAFGDTGNWTSIGCDLSIGLVLDLPILVRDLVVFAINYISGRQDPSYLTASIALLFILVKAIPLLGDGAKVLATASDVVKGTPLEKILKEKMLQAADDAQRLGSSAIPDEGLIRLLGREGDVATKKAFVELFQGIRNKSATWSRLERLGDVFGHERLVLKMAQLGADPKYGKATVERLVRALDQMNDARKFATAGASAGATLTDDALEGMAIFIKHIGTNKPPNLRRLNRIWAKDFASSGLNTSQQLGKMNDMFAWIKQGEAALGSKPGWSLFLRKGPGTLPVNGTAGSFHVLERVVKDHRLQDIIDFEVRSGGRYIDILRRHPVTRKIIREELKNFKAGAKFSDHFGAEVLKDVRSAIARAGGARATPSAIIDELQRLQYTFRGTLDNAMKKALVDAIGTSLGKRNAKYANQVTIEFLGRSVPF